MKYKLTFALVASLTSTAFAAFQAPLPEFKNEKQLAEWRAEKTSKASSQGYVAEEAAFYTGKPYIISSGTYAFKFRSYDSGLGRWTSEDPSGYPDGSNNHRYVEAPTQQYDPYGLSTIDGGTSPLPNPTAWTYGGKIHDEWTGWIFEFRVQEQYLSWETAKAAAFTGAYGDAVTAVASGTLTQTETWGWNGAANFQAGITQNVKFTVGGGYTQGGTSGSGSTIGGGTTKAATPGVAWTADILIANTQLMQQVAFFTYSNGQYTPHPGSRGNWTDDKILTSGYAGNYGIKWIGQTE